MLFEEMIKVIFLIIVITEQAHLVSGAVRSAIASDRKWQICYLPYF